MGYRNYIGSLSKVEHEKIKKMTINQLLKYKKDDHVCGFQLINSIYGFGAYIDSFDNIFFKPVFIRPTTQKYFDEEHDFYIVEKEFLAEFIKRYAEKIRNIYKEMLNPFFDKKGNPISDFLNYAKIKHETVGNRHLLGDLTKITEQENRSIIKMIEHIKSFANEFGVSTYFEPHLPYELDEKPNITTSWKFEYTQFELVRIYKQFDWNNNLMIYYGY